MTTFFPGPENPGSPVTSQQKPIIFRYLENSIGQINWGAVDGTTPQLFRLVVPAEFTFHWTSCTIYLQDFGLVSPARFGARTRLLNGCQLLIRDASGTVVEDFGGTELPILSNFDLSFLAASPAEYQVAEVNGSVLAHLDFIQTIGEPIVVPTGNDITWRVRDNLSAEPIFNAVTFVRGFLVSTVAG